MRSSNLSPTAIYIPFFNRRVFYQAPIGWEWGLVIGLSIVFIVWCEVWKLMRKPLYRRWEPKPVNLAVGGESGGADLTRTPTYVGPKDGEKQEGQKAAKVEVKHTEAE